jgi:predicted DNA-binding transcriptional regulator AlpA
MRTERLRLNEVNCADDASAHPPPQAHTRPAVKLPDQLEPTAVSAETVCKLAGNIGESTLWRLVAAGKFLRPFKLGGRSLWILAEVRAWLEAGAPDVKVWQARKAAGRRDS